MTRKQEFLKFINELMTAAPEVTNSMSDGAKDYLNALSGGENTSKPQFTENGKLVLKYLQEHPESPMLKAKDIAEGLFIGSRQVSGSVRKLVTDGYVEKVGQDPVVYALTEMGKTINIDEE